MVDWHIKYSWVKKLGQWHYADDTPGLEGRTICGRPMLGNNYAEAIPEEKRVPCKECHNAVNERKC